jgi:hypothetical protein
MFLNYVLGGRPIVQSSEKTEKHKKKTNKNNHTAVAISSNVGFQRIQHN